MAAGLIRNRTFRMATILIVLVCFFNVFCLEGLAEELAKAEDVSAQDEASESSSEKTVSSAPAPKDMPAPASSESSTSLESSASTEGFLVSDPVDVTTGKVYETVTDFIAPCKGGLLKMGVTRTYSSMMPSDKKLNSFARGWVFQYDTYIYVNQDGHAFWHTPTGSRVQFTYSNGTYTPPAGTAYSLTRNPTYGFFTLTEFEGGTKWYFSTIGAYEPTICSLTKIEDRNTNSITMAYNTSIGRITTATESGGRYISFAYDSSKRITTATDPAGSAYGYAYNVIAGKNLVVVYPNDPNHVHLWYAYDANYKLTAKFLHHDGSVWKYQWSFLYDDSNRCTKITYPDSTYDTVSYPSASQTNATDGLGRTVSFYYDGNKHVTKTTDANGSNIFYYYDASHNKTRMTDRRGQNYYYAYDSSYNMTRETKPGNIVTDYTYNSFGQVTSILDPLDRQTDYYYDASGNVTRVMDDSSNETFYAYDAAGNRTSMTDANDHTTTFEYDAYGQITRVTNAEDEYTTYAYDIIGNRTSVTDPNSNTTTFAYDKMNNVTRVTDPLSNYVTYEYDRMGSRTGVIDQNGNETTYEYDWRQKVTKITDALSQETEFAYDAIGNLTSMTDAKNNVTEFDYEFGAGCGGCGGSGSVVTRVTYPNDDYETFQYDANGNLTLKTDCNGASISYAYDALNQMTLKTYPGSVTASFAYDKMGNMTSATDSDSSVSFVYDNLYRIAETAQQIYGQPGYTIGYEYDPVGNRTSMTDPDDLTTSYTYTLLDQLASITDVYSNATNYYYDDGGRLTLRTYGNGTKAEFEYDEANRLTLLANRKSDDSVISSFDYEHDDAGNRTKRTTPSQTLQYSYDNIYEVTEVYQLEPTLATLETFSYDDIGNRTSDVDYDDYTYNSNNKLTSYDSVTLEYDKNGNLTKKTENGTDITTYTFDYENKLIRIDYPDETYSAYKYDPLGRRIEKSDRSGNIRRYVYDRENFIAEYDGSNSLLATYVQSLSIDNPISVCRGSEMYWYHTDVLGSVYNMTDSSQGMARSYNYSAFGEIGSSSGTIQNPFTYAGRECDDESGMYYFRFRYYEASIGRFVNPDPLFNPSFALNAKLERRLVRAMIAIDDASELKKAGVDRKYIFPQNNPVNLVDPFGLDYRVCMLICVGLCVPTCLMVCLPLCEGLAPWATPLCVWACRSGCTIGCGVGCHNGCCIAYPQAPLCCSG